MNVSVGAGLGVFVLRVSSRRVCGGVSVPGVWAGCVCAPPSECERECIAQCESVRVTGELCVCVYVSGRVYVRVTTMGCGSE